MNRAERTLLLAVARLMIRLIEKRVVVRGRLGFVADPDDAKAARQDFDILKRAYEQVNLDG